MGGIRSCGDNVRQIDLLRGISLKRYTLSLKLSGEYSPKSAEDSSSRLRITKDRLSHRYRQNRGQVVPLLESEMEVSEADDN